jgi:beta-lactam-binding protein with PASTA domain
LHQHFWLLPFFCFGLGYYLVSLVGYGQVIDVPSVVGLSLQDSLKSLSALGLTVAVKAEKEDAQLVEGTVIHQLPQPGQKVKSHQSVFLVITKKPPIMYTPTFINLSQQEAQEQARRLGIRLKISSLESHYPQGLCIAQLPLVGKPLPEKIMQLYISAGITPLRIVPDCRGYPVDEVVDFLKRHVIEVKMFSTDHFSPSKSIDELVDDHAIVRDQRPLPGSVINSTKFPVMYLSIASR